MSTSDLVAGAAVKAASPEAAEVVLKKEAAEAYPETKSLDLNPLHWGSIYHWARDHRVHHKHSETDADPHNATRGFFFAHMGWLYVKKHPDIMVEGKKLDFSDLSRDGFVMFQKHLDPWFTLFMCFVFPALVAKFGWGENFWNAFWVAGALRYVVVLHCTWLVNSAAHFFGDHPYDDQWPAENPFVSLASIGEGWHNWHHKYPYDYAASEFGIGSQFNPTKLFIDGAAALGLVWNRKRATSAWERSKVKRDAGGVEKTAVQRARSRSGAAPRRRSAARAPHPRLSTRPHDYDARRDGDGHRRGEAGAQCTSGGGKSGFEDRAARA
ncbi:oxidoreductase [Aureococcus anophagefferens]|nr:oxidoreductase [Aureococcus anophagefferens]